MLRTLIQTTALAILFGAGSTAQAQIVTPNEEQNDLQYLLDLTDRAEEAGKAFDLPNGDTIDRALTEGIKIPSFAQMLRSSPELRDVLPLGEILDEFEQSQAPNLNEYGVVLVSFSMPEESLRQLALQANKYGFTTVFRGLVNNSMIDTMEKLSQVFGDDLEQMNGFSINPTVFRRFDVETVPAYLFLDAPLEPCTTQGCTGDPLPKHDVVYGNVPFEYAAQVVKNEGGVGAFAATRLLERGEVSHE